MIYDPFFPRSFPVVVTNSLAGVIEYTNEPVYMLVGLIEFLSYYNNLSARGSLISLLSGCGHSFEFAVGQQMIVLHDMLGIGKLI